MTDLPLALALWTGFAAAALSCLLTIGVALVLWIPDADATATSTSIVHAGVITFLTAMHGGVHLNGVHIGFVPLGMPLAVIAACLRFSRSTWSHPRAATVSPGRLIGAQAGAFTVTCALLVPSARLGTTSLGWTGTLLGAAVVSTLGFGLGAVRVGVVDPREWLPLPLRTAVQAATAALAVLITGGALLAAVATGLAHGRFATLSNALAGGVSSVPIAVLETLTVPNAVLAASAFLAGPGFDVGAAHYAVTGSRPGPVPGFPILSGLPRAASTAPVAVLILAVFTVLGAGLVAGLLAHRGTRTGGWRAGMAVAALAGVVAGAVMSVLSALAGGQLGAHALRSVGPSPWWVGLVVAGEVAALAVVTDLVRRGVERLRSSGDGSVQAPSAGKSATPAMATDSATATLADATTVELPAIVPAAAGSTALDLSAIQPADVESAPLGGSAVEPSRPAPVPAAASKPTTAEAVPVDDEEELPTAAAS